MTPEQEFYINYSITDAKLTMYLKFSCIILIISIIVFLFLYLHLENKKIKTLK